MIILILSSFKFDTIKLYKLTII